MIYLDKAPDYILVKLFSKISTPYIKSIGDEVLLESKYFNKSPNYPHAISNTFLIFPLGSFLITFYIKRHRLITVLWYSTISLKPVS